MPPNQMTPFALANSAVLSEACEKLAKEEFESFVESDPFFESAIQLAEELYFEHCNPSEDFTMKEEENQSEIEDRVFDLVFQNMAMFFLYRITVHHSQQRRKGKHGLRSA